MINSLRIRFKTCEQLMEETLDSIRHLTKHFKEEELNCHQPFIYRIEHLKKELDFLSSFQMKISYSTLKHNLKMLRLMNYEELKKVYDFGDDLDVVERRIQLIDYLDEDEKDLIFRQDKAELLKLNLFHLDSVLNLRLIEYFLNISDFHHLYRRYRVKFAELNPILRTYSRYLKMNKRFLNPGSLPELNANFFNHIVNRLPSSYFDNYLNLNKLNKFFSIIKVEAHFDVLMKYLPNLTVIESIDLLCLLRTTQFRRFELLFKQLFQSFDVIGQEDAYKIVFKYMIALPKTEQTKKFIENSMYLPDHLDESDLITAYLTREPDGKRASRSDVTIGMIETILAINNSTIRKQLRKHPYYNKVRFDDVSAIVQFLGEQKLTPKQINGHLEILLYSLQSIKDKFELLRNDEIYERIRTKDNFIEYLIYFIEKDTSFSGKAAFLNKEVE